VTAALAFELPDCLEASEPPEARGLARDDVRLLVASRAGGDLVHARFRDLPAFLREGDVLVVNTSRTIPAAIAAARADGGAIEVRFATKAPDLGEAWWVVEPRGDVVVGDWLTLPGGAALHLVTRYAGGRRLWLGRLESERRLLDLLDEHGFPVRYDYVPKAWPLDAYQTVFATTPGSAEMPSAGRPFSAELVTRLVSRGVRVAPVTLHTGVSSPERHEPPYPERYAVSAATADLVNHARGRVVAVGTTAVRALETVADEDGTVAPGEGWTGLVVDPETRPLRRVDALITGWHEPQASHLRLLEAAAGPELLADSYAAALDAGYLWHEFGDSHLVVP
jgi:S-adenosylmethionine:tRNA ribosyltransferase-isomerase